MNTTEVAAHGRPNAEQEHAANYAGVVHALLACEEACNACAVACEEEVGWEREFRRCIRLTLDCADVCGAMLRLLMRQVGAPNALVHAQLQACTIACRLCADECKLHGNAHSQCQVCAEICQHCAERSHRLLDNLDWSRGSTPPFATA